MNHISRCSLLSVAVALALAVSVAYAAPGGIPGRPLNPGGGGGGGNKPPVELSNNLSFPAVSATLSTEEARWNSPAEPLLGVTYSYGCDKPETLDDQFSYPNTSCVDDLATPTVFLTAEQCTAAGAKCEGLPVDRIYWQKVDANDWWADSATETPRTAAYLDWGDALEAVSWNERSVIRVETQPYGSLLVDPATGLFDPFEPALETCVEAVARLYPVSEYPDIDPADYCKIGFQMWHVAGQGITEQWGVRVEDATPNDPYIYESPFQIIHTTTARLNLAKLVPESATCPEPGEGTGDLPPAGPFTWDAENSTWVSGEDPATGLPVCTWLDAVYSSELSVTGKYVCGYNWRMKNVELESLCGMGWEKTGYWRLTFRTTNDAVVFDELNPVLATTAPPAVPADSNPLPVVAVLAEEEEEEEDTDALYTPVVDYDNNLTYLDICIKAKTQGGGGGSGSSGGRQ
jgi:hypothetical protein